MTLPEANAAIDVHNGNPIGAGNATAKLDARKTKRTDAILYQVCDRLHVAPARLAEVPVDRVVGILKETHKHPIEEATVKAEVARFAADHAEPEASPLKAR